MIFKFSSISNTKGVPVGKFKSRIFSSEIFNKYLIINLIKNLYFPHVYKYNLDYVLKI